MGTLTYQGESPFRVTPLRPSTARVAGENVEMTVYVSGPYPRSGVVEIDAPLRQIEVPMSPDDARRLAAELRAKADETDRRRKR